MASMSTFPATSATSATSAPVCPGPLHHEPPFRVTDFFHGRRHWLAAAGAAVALLALGAAIAHGYVLLTWDEPIQHWVESHRTEVGDRLFLTVSSLGSTITVLTLGTVLAALTWSRCRAVSIAIVVAMLGRPVIEATLKMLVDRDRPDFDRLVDGNGPSFPSGHPMAAVALYGFIPVVVALYTHRHRVVMASWAITVAIIGGVAASRVYLGVHWFSDVAASILLTSFLLIAIEWTIERAHAVSSCHPIDNEFDPVEMDPAVAAELDEELHALHALHAGRD